MEKRIVNRYNIYIGLNDKIECRQRFTTEKFKRIVKKVCRNYVGAYTMDIVQGGYTHEDGTPVEENSVVLTLIDTEEENVWAIAKELAAFFRQESVMVIQDTVKVAFVKNVLEE